MIQVRATLPEALAMWASWHSDHGFNGPTGNYAVDMKIADAFRMMIHLGHDKARMKWIEREIFGRHDVPPVCAYHATLCGWWLSLWDAQQSSVGRAA